MWRLGCSRWKCKIWWFWRIIFKINKKVKNFSIYWDGFFSLSIDKLGQVIQADDGFLLVVSYNPGYQNAVKDLKHSTRQRFVAIEFDFPGIDRETKIIAHEAEIDEGISNQLAVLGQKIRNLREHGLEEGASTRLLIYAGRLIKQGIAPKRACQVALTWGITDEAQIQETVDQIVSSIFE